MQRAFSMSTRARHTARTPPLPLRPSPHLPHESRALQQVHQRDCAPQPDVALVRAQRQCRSHRQANHPQGHEVDLRSMHQQHTNSAASGRKQFPRSAHVAHERCANLELQATTWLEAACAALVLIARGPHGRTACCSQWRRSQRPALHCAPCHPTQVGRAGAGPSSKRGRQPAHPEARRLPACAAQHAGEHCVAAVAQHRKRHAGQRRCHRSLDLRGDRAGGGPSGQVRDRGTG